MPNYRRPWYLGGRFFFTVVTERRRCVFSEDRARRQLHRVVRKVQAERPFELIAIVLLPEHDLIHHVNYIHYNPIKHGLVRCPHAWPWSSFHRWVRDGYYKRDWLCDCDGRPKPQPPDCGGVLIPGE